jgi:uncharacterized protein
MRLRDHVLCDTAAELRRRLRDYSVILSEPRAALFDKRTLTARPVERVIGVILARMLSTVDALPEDSPAWGTIREILSAWDGSAFVSPLAELVLDLPSPRRSTTDDPSTRVLHKLALNVTSTCNLSCAYCYADGGQYRTRQSGVLSPANVRSYIERVSGLFDVIDEVQFMGGEPTLQVSAIEQAVDTFRALVDNGRLRAMPRFQVVTNGLVLSPRFLELAKRAGLAVTVSIDGPPEVHDSVRRIRSTGGGSYSAVRRSIDTARAFGLRLEYEATFSRRHLEIGMHLIDLCQWFHDEFGVQTLHAPPVSPIPQRTQPFALSAQEKVRGYTAVTAWGMDNLVHRGQVLMHGFTARILSNIAARTPNRVFCLAGHSMLCVSTNGDLSPCWMFSGEPLFTIGNAAQGAPLHPRARQLFAVMRRNELGDHPRCRKCFAQTLCFGCKGADYNATRSLSKKTECECTRAMIATVLGRVVNGGRAGLSTGDYVREALSRSAVSDELSLERTGEDPEPCAVTPR